MASLVEDLLISMEEGMKGIELYCKYISKSEMKSIADALKVNSSLTNLSLESNLIGNEGAMFLADALTKNMSLTSLGLSSNRIGNEGVKSLADALKENTGLSRLGLSFNEIGDEGAMFLADALRENSSLTNLNLENNLIGNVGVKCLADALERNTGLTCLYLKLNRIAGGAMFLANALKVNESLDYLGLEGNRFGPKGTKFLADALKVNTSLTRLAFSSNDIGDKGARCLADSLKENTILAVLDLQGNGIGHEGAKSLADALKVNTSLTILNLWSNIIGDEGAMFLADALKVNTVLTSLHLKTSGISEEGAMCLLDALKVNTSLTRLDIPFNGNDRIDKEIEDRLETNRKLKKRKFLDALKSEKKAPLNRSRLMFVGQGKTGKSATVRSLLGKRFSPVWDSTIGADISEGITSSATSKWRNPDQLRGDFTSRFAARLVVTHSGTSSRQNSKITDQAHKRNGKPRGHYYHQSTAVEDVKANVASTTNTSVQEPEEATSRKGQLNKSPGITESVLDEDHAHVTRESNYDIAREYEENLLLDAQRNANTITLSLWDFGGQQVFYAMHHIFLTQSGVYILLFDMRELLEPTKREEASKYLLFWLRSVKLHAPKASLILTGTFLADVGERENLRTVDIILRELIKATFSQIVPNIDESFIYFPIDNKEGLGIDKLRGIVEESARNDDGVFENVSIRWMAFLDKIYSERDKVSYLTLSRDIRDIGLEVGISNSIEQEAALALFHERGLLIHLTSTLVLKNIVVIKPQWLIVVLSKVICDGNLHIDKDQFKHVGLEEDLKATFEKGLASRDFLEYVWKGECELEQVDFFLDLMERTMLLSRWNFSENELYLIPSLLTDHSFVEKENFKGPRCVIDFSNSFLPNGVFQRLLCLCVAHSIRVKANDDDAPNELVMEPSLHKRCATIEFEPGCITHLLEDEYAQSITISVENDEFAGKCIRVVQAMLRKVNHDVMGSGLHWDIYLENGVTKELMCFREAQKEKLPPWFSTTESEHLIETSVISLAENVDLLRFLESL